MFAGSSGLYFTWILLGVDVKNRFRGFASGSGPVKRPTVHSLTQPSLQAAAVLCRAVDLTLWTSHHGPHTVDLTSWTSHRGPHTVDLTLWTSPWTSHRGPHTVDLTPWTSLCGPHTVDLTLWTSHRGPHTVDLTMDLTPWTSHREPHTVDLTDCPALHQVPARCCSHAR